MPKNDLIAELKQRKRQKEQEEKSEKRKIEQLAKSKKYSTEVLVSNSPLGGVYHDLINKKDRMDVKMQSDINRTSNDIDTLLYKLNKKIENKTDLIDYKINQKEEQLKERLKY
ncbi:hypothetical protein [Methanosphaera cuniculi]|uniref:hypothetical protein n=1 Tax=Methanosphaera cuniculi TaxID=1077256 RepID=UPI0026ED40DC|nr:hypothetical protein [Methanosphaera cuniculi]